MILTWNETPNHHGYRLWESHFNHGVRDERGRHVGHFLTICADRVSYDPTKPYCFEPRLLKNGVPFGALPVAAYRYFATVEEAKVYAEAWIAKQVKAVRKRYAPTARHTLQT